MNKAIIDHIIDRVVAAERNSVADRGSVEELLPQLAEARALLRRAAPVIENDGSSELHQELHADIEAFLRRG